MKKIPLTQGKFALVDDADYDELSRSKWHAVKAHKTFYACRAALNPATGIKTNKQSMHRQILMPKGNLVVDHINHNGLDNQRSNIRVCSHTENMRNREKNYSNKSGYKGTTWDKHHKKWKSFIHLGGKDKILGYYFCLIRAAKSYDEAASKYYGEFALTNF